MKSGERSLPAADLLISGASELITGSRGSDRASVLNRIPGGAVAISGDRVIAVGPESEVRRAVGVDGARFLDARRGVVAPGFVDAHTHLVFGGSRMREYAARLTRTREETEAIGIPVGILATVEATRRASREELAAAARPRLDEMLVHGTTTAESKSGYGLTTADEVKLLEVNRWLDAEHPVDLLSTFMGAHDIPPETDRKRYVDEVVAEQIPEVARLDLARFCDVFCDDGWFTPEDAERVLEAGVSAGMSPKIHAEQYARTGGAGVAAGLGCVSADHLNYATRDDLEAMAAAGVTAVLMPLIDFAVKHPRPIDARMWLEAGLTVGLGTDLCPGGYTASMPLVVQFACRVNGLSPEEAILAATAGAATACGLADRGTLAPGALADLQVWDVASLEEMVYRIGHNPVRTVIKRGKVVYG
ncbi:MAG: imidazolonepropionase [marine benthic group bacterium]|nr:imidazolonepropionase [Gemmatimonadota bacterium]